jgi:hypothetical protein
MQAASIVFPFKQALRGLELGKRWWHRLCVVILFTTLLCVAAFTAVVAGHISSIKLRQKV